jgi:hypothetical protein
MKRSLIAFAALAFLNLPAAAIGAQPPADHSQHMMPPHGDHGAMEKTRTQTIMLGEQTVDGIKAKGLLNDVGAMMAQMGKKENYHFMVMFSDAATGAAIEQGIVAAKITDPTTGQASEAIPLMGMGNHYGADVALPNKGEYKFQVGTKLTDGKTRQFQFSHTIK